MKRIRQYTYVERELIRRRAEKKRKTIERITNFFGILAFVVSTEVFMFALVLMS